MLCNIVVNLVYNGAWVTLQAERIFINASLKHETRLRSVTARLEWLMRRDLRRARLGQEATCHAGVTAGRNTRYCTRGDGRGRVTRG